MIIAVVHVQYADGYVANLQDLHAVRVEPLLVERALHLMVPGAEHGRNHGTIAASCNAKQNCAPTSVARRSRTSTTTDDTCDGPNACQRYNEVSSLRANEGDAIRYASAPSGPRTTTTTRDAIHHSR